MHRVLVALGGTPRGWRTDRMATFVIPGTDRLTVDAAQAAKHYGTEITACPPRRAQRKGVVEAAIKHLIRSWWRSAHDQGPALPLRSSGASQAVADPRGADPRRTSGAHRPYLTHRLVVASVDVNVSLFGIVTLQPRQATVRRVRFTSRLRQPVRARRTAACHLSARVRRELALSAGL